MKLLFNELHIENFMSIGSADVSLANNGFVAVYGVNNNALDLAESNGSGKSSIWEALFWCLTGSTVRGAKDIVNHFADDGCFVKLNFTIDNSEYEITRSKDHSTYKTNLKIFVDGKFIGWGHAVDVAIADYNLCKAQYNYVKAKNTLKDARHELSRIMGFPEYNKHSTSPPDLLHPQTG